MVFWGWGGSPSVGGSQRRRGEREVCHSEHQIEGSFSPALTPRTAESAPPELRPSPAESEL